MLSIQALNDFGVNTAEGMTRCLNNEQFYFRLITKAVADAGFDKLKAAIDAGDLNTAFELAHALKGVTGNLALTPLYEPVSEMTELLRTRSEADYGPMVDKLLERRQALQELCK